MNFTKQFFNSYKSHESYKTCQPQKQGLPCRLLRMSQLQTPLGADLGAGAKVSSSDF